MHDHQSAQRLGAVEAAAAQAGLDLLIVPGRGVISHYGYLQFVAHYAPVIRMGAAIIEPDRPPILALTSASDCALAKPLSPIADIRLMSLDGNAEEPDSLAALVKQRTAGRAAPKIGVVGIEEIVPARMLDVLRAAAPQASFVSATRLLQELKAVKTQEDIQGLRVAAAIADAGLAALVAALKDPLCTLQAAAGAAAEALYARGASEILIYASKGPDYLHRPRAERLEAGDLLTVVIEASTADGYWVELFRLIARGELAPLQARLVSDSQAIMGAAELAFVPGQTASQAYGTLAAMIQARGYTSGLWLGHGVGVDHDLPVIGAADPTPLQPNMVIAFHPHLVNAEAGCGASLGDTYLVTAVGGEPLSQWSRDLIQV